MCVCALAFGRLSLWGKICMAPLLGVPVSLVIPSSDVAFSQSGPRSQAPLYTAIDLHFIEFTRSEALGVSEGQQVGDSSDLDKGHEHALLWRGSAASVVDLTPNGWRGEATATCGGQQVGFGSGPATGGDTHALMWRGSAANVVDLHPRGFHISQARGAFGAEQVGNGSPPTGGSHALLWRGSAASVVDLHPNGFDFSEADGTSGGEQVGWGSGPTTGGATHALLWRGTAESVVDLNPRGFDGSTALATSGGQQVGWGIPIGKGNFPFHALLWRGTGESAVDLNPHGGNHFSQAYGTNGQEQVGLADGHAVLWRSDAASMVDLHTFLPQGFQSSIAFGIDSARDIVGIASTEHHGPSHAIFWKRNGPRPGTSRKQNTTGC